ncbi:MAG: transporter [Bacteroidia bacterium]
MKIKEFFFAVAFIASAKSQLYAQINDTSANTLQTKKCFECCRPDALAPAGIMTDHVHPKGEFGLAYGWMFSESKGNMQGTKNLSDDEIYYNKGYMMAPHLMRMHMLMLMPMYGITNRLTAMAMVMYNVNKMNMRMMSMENMQGMAMDAYSDMPTSSRSSGLGDTKLYLLYNLLNDCIHRLVLSGGVSIPTGKTDAKGATLQGPNEVLPYSMQLGTGTLNLLPGLVYTLQTYNLNFGAAVSSNIKTGANDRDYRWGNEYSFSPWFAYKIKSWVSISARVEYYRMERIQGYDVTLNLSSGNDPSDNVLNYGMQQRVNVYGGINLYTPSSCFKGMRLMAEYGLPVYNEMVGLQMPAKSFFNIRIQYDFKKQQ